MARPGGLAGEIGKQHAFKRPEVEAFLNLQRTADRLADAPKGLLKNFELSPSLFNALVIVVGAGEGGVPVRRIAERMVVREPDISRLLDRLEARKLVRRVRSQLDRRVVEMHALAKGRALVARIRPKLDEIHVEQLAQFSAAELDTLNELLVRMRTAAVGAKGA